MSKRSREWLWRTWFNFSWTEIIWPSKTQVNCGLVDTKTLLYRMSEEKTDNILDDVEEEVQEIDPREDPNKKNDKPTLDETVQKLIGKAGNNMESTLIGQLGIFA